MRLQPHPRCLPTRASRVLLREARQDLAAVVGDDDDASILTSPMAGRQTWGSTETTFPGSSVSPDSGRRLGNSCTSSPSPWPEAVSVRFAETRGFDADARVRVDVASQPAGAHGRKARELRLGDERVRLR